MSVPGWWAGAVADSLTPDVTGWLSDWGAEGVLALAVVMLFTGGLVPWRTVREIRADRDKYREANELKDAAIKELAESVATVRDVLKALENVATKSKDPSP